MKSKIIFLIFVLSFLILITNASAEEITITTYYPAPYGSYKELYISDGLRIGEQGTRDDMLHLSGSSAVNPPYIRLQDIRSGFEKIWRLMALENKFVIRDQDSVENVLVIDTNGNVGIGTGTTSPAEKLVIKGSASSSSDEDVLSIVNGASLGAWDVNVHRGIIWRGGEGGNDIKARIAAEPDAGGDWNLDFYTTTDSGANVVRQMRITDDGNVGIGTGTTGPADKLDVVVVPYAGNTNGGIGLWSEGNPAFIKSAIRLKSDANGVYRLALGWDASTVYPENEAVSIAPITGNVGIGTVGPLSKLSVGGVGESGLAGYFNGDVKIVGTGPTGGLFLPNIAGGGGTPVYVGSIASGRQIVYFSSSKRYKHDIRDYKCEINKIPKLRPVRFKWNKDTASPNEEDFGLIAEDVYEVFPELVTLGPKGPESVKYDKLPVILLKAIQEQQKQIDSLKAEIKSLKEKIKP